MSSLEIDLLLSVLVEIIVRSTRLYKLEHDRWVDYPKVGTWVVECSHVSRRGDIRAVGKVKEYRNRGVVLELLDGSEQYWENAAFSVIEEPHAKTLEAYRAEANKAREA